MTAFLWVWLATQAIGVGLVWLFTVGLGRPVRLTETPRVAVVVAVKGHDEEFDEFLVRLFEQDYPAFRVIFTVESSADAAVPAIEQCRLIAPERVSLVVAGLRRDEGQKITNLRAAVATLTPDDEILVLADADIWPEPDWLARVVEPLVADEADVVSGFAWLIVKDNRLASYVLTAMAASIATIPRLPLLNPAWGGCIAMAQETFRDLDIAEEWSGTLSDDLQLTNVVQQAGGRIRAPREILLRTAVKTGGFAAVTAEARRWFMLARVYMPFAYWVSVGAMSFSALGWIVGILGTLALQLDVAVVLVLALALGVVRSFGRARLVRKLWGTSGSAENARYLRIDFLVSPLATVMNAIYGWSALTLTRTKWAGITYEILGPQEVLVVKRE
jgi:ceramide glucosyltransferase